MTTKRHGPARPAQPTPPPGRAGACRAKTKDGKPCRAAARPGRPWCFTHDPDLAAVRAASRKRAGASTAARLSRKVLGTDQPAPALDTSRALVEHLGELIVRVERGELDTKPAAVVAQLANVLLRALANVEVVERIGALERAVAALPTGEAEGFASDLAAVRAASEARQ